MLGASPEPATPTPDKRSWRPNTSYVPHSVGVMGERRARNGAWRGVEVCAVIADERRKRLESRLAGRRTDRVEVRDVAVTKARGLASASMGPESGSSRHRAFVGSSWRPVV